MELYDRVCNIAGRTNCVIQTQELILNEIICNMKQYMNPADIKKFLGNFDINTNYIEIFNSLLDTTLSLRNSMDNVRKCCDRLINAEEKRNEIGWYYFKFQSLLYLSNRSGASVFNPSR